MNHAEPPNVKGIKSPRKEPRRLLKEPIILWATTWSNKSLQRVPHHQHDSVYDYRSESYTNSWQKQFFLRIRNRSAKLQAEQQNQADRGRAGGRAEPGGVCPDIKARAHILVLRCITLHRSVLHSEFVSVYTSRGSRNHRRSSVMSL